MPEWLNIPTVTLTATVIGFTILIVFVTKVLKRQEDLSHRLAKVERTITRSREAWDSLRVFQNGLKQEVHNGLIPIPSIAHGIASLERRIDELSSSGISRNAAPNLQNPTGCSPNELSFVDLANAVYVGKDDVHHLIDRFDAKRLQRFGVESLSSVDVKFKEGSPSDMLGINVGGGWHGIPMPGKRLTLGYKISSGLMHVFETIGEVGEDEGQVVEVMEPASLKFSRSSGEWSVVKKGAIRVESR